MKNIIYMIGTSVWTIFNFSLVVGIFLILLYVLTNIFSQSRMFSKCSSKIKKFFYKIIDFSYVWGPNLLIFYLIGRLLIRIINFLLSN